MSTLPIAFRWTDDGAMVPASRFLARRADQEYTVGEEYVLVEENQRSPATHKHEFAFIREAWPNLPERYSQEPWAQSPEHLRKYALIKTGFSNTQTWVCKSKAEARRWAANIRPRDEYAIVIAEGWTVVEFTAKSQARGAMDAKEFQRSKQAILEFIAGLIEVSPEVLEQHARAA